MVSVIVPNYNHAAFLKERIESVLNQTDQDFEVIILDDCSPDNSKEIIEQYRNHPKITHIVYNEKNSGSPFKQWKKGIDLAKGEYIWIAESDDVADISFLEKVMKSIRENNPVLCFVRSLIIDESGEVVIEKNTVLDNAVCRCVEFLEKYLLYGNGIYNASMAVFRKDIIKDAGWERIIKLKYCGDWLFWTEALTGNKGIVSELKEPLNSFRTHSTNVSNKSEIAGLSILEGFSISKQIAKNLNLRNKKDFNEKWYGIWYSYRIYYRFSKKTNLKILFMFLTKQPRIAMYELKRLFLKIFKL